MNGLEKMTGKLISEAEEYAAAVVAAAEEKARLTDAEYEKAALAITEEAERKAQKEEERILGRAESSGRMLRAEAELSARAELIDECFAETGRRIVGMDAGSYAALFGKQLEAAVRSQIESERRAAERGDGEEDASFAEEYTVIFNSRDRDGAASAVTAYAKKAAEEGGKRLTVSDSTVPAAGGFILRCGDVEINCTLEALMKQARARLEAQVSRSLFE